MAKTASDIVNATIKFYSEHPQPTTANITSSKSAQSTATTTKTTTTSKKSSGLSGALKNNSASTSSGNSSIDTTELSKTKIGSKIASGLLSRITNFTKNGGVSLLNFNNEGKLVSKDEFNKIKTENAQQRASDILLNKTNEDNAVGQFTANFDSSRLQQLASQAWSSYMDNPTEENKKIAQNWDNLYNDYTAKNEKALDDENAKATLITKNLASYLPQVQGQAQYSGVTAPTGYLLGNTAGLRAGLTAGSTLYSYDTTRGASFKNLTSLGANEDVAKSAATDEAILSSGVEMADTAFDLFFGVGKKLFGGVAKETAKSTVKSFAKELAKYGINAEQEGFEESIQEILSMANEQRIADGKGTGGVEELLEYAKDVIPTVVGENQDADSRARVEGAFKGGRNTALIVGGTQTGLGHVKQRVANNIIAEQEATQRRKPWQDPPWKDRPDQVEAEAIEQEQPAQTQVQAEHERVVQAEQPPVAQQPTQAEQPIAQQPVVENPQPQVVPQENQQTETQTQTEEAPQVQETEYEIRHEPTELSLDQKKEAVKEWAGKPASEKSKAVTKGKLKAVVNDLLSSVDSQKTKTSTLEAVEKINDYVLDHDSKTFNEEEFEAMVDDLANDIADNVIEVVSDNREIHNGIRDFFADAKINPIGVKEGMNDFNEFRSKNRFLLHFNNSSNRSIDSYYDELSDMYPGVFPKDITNPADQAIAIANAYEFTKNELTTSGFANDMERQEAIDTLKNIIYGAVNNSEIQNSVDFFNKKYNNLIKKHGAIPNGANPQTNIRTPRKSENGQKVSQVVRSVLETKGGEIRQDIIKEATVQDFLPPVKGVDVEATMEAEMQKAETDFHTAVEEWMSEIEDGKTSDELVTRGAILLTLASNREDVSSDYYIYMLSKQLELESNAGHALYRSGLIKKLTPEGKLLVLQRTVKNLNKDLGIETTVKPKAETVTETQSTQTETTEEAKTETKTKETSKPKAEKENKATPVEIPSELVDKYREQTTEKGRAEVIEEINKSIAKQIPSTANAKAAALRYSNLLSGLATGVRNTAGNFVSFLNRKAKDSVKAVLQKFGNAEMEKTAAWFPGRKRIAAAAETLNTLDISDIKGENRYTFVGNTKIPKEISEHMTIFKYGDNAVTRKLGIAGEQGPGFKLLEAKRKAIDSALNGKIGDELWIKLNFIDSLAQYMKANNITAEQWAEMQADPMKNNELYSRAIEYASNQAQQATFRDKNAVSDAFANFDKNLPNGAKVVTQGVMPFRRTPANVLVRGVEYSPVGLVDSLIVKPIKESKGKITSSELIDGISKGVVGTSIFAVGILAGLSGIARTKDDDDKLEEQAQRMGYEDYSINVDGKSITADWLTPSSISFFMGVELSKALKDGEITGDEVAGIIGSCTDLVVESSVLKGLDDALDTVAKYNDDTSSIFQVVANAATAYLLQHLTDSFIGSIERGTEKYRQTYYTDKNSGLSTTVQRQLAKASSKIPGIDYQTADYIDVWGRKEKGSGLLNSMVNPAYVGNITTDEVEEELTKLYEAGYNVMPSSASRSDTITINGENKDIPLEKFETYAITKGEKSYEYLSKFMESKEYKWLDDEEKAEIISKLYSMATAQANKTVYSNYKSDYDKYLSSSDPAQYYISRNSLASFMDSEDYSNIDKFVRNVDKLPKATVQALMEDTTTSRLDELVRVAKVGVTSKQWYEAYDNSFKAQPGVTTSKDNTRICGYNLKPYLQSEMSAGRLTSEQANAIWNTIYTGSGTLASYNGKPGETTAEEDKKQTKSQKSALSILYGDSAEEEITSTETDETDQGEKEMNPFVKSVLEYYGIG